MQLKKTDWMFIGFHPISATPQRLTHNTAPRFGVYKLNDTQQTQWNQLIHKLFWPEPGVDGPYTVTLPQTGKQVTVGLHPQSHQIAYLAIPLDISPYQRQMPHVTRGEIRFLVTPKTQQLKAHPVQIALFDEEGKKLPMSTHDEMTPDHVASLFEHIGLSAS